MKVGVCSDLHLDFGGSKIDFSKNTELDLLLLAGDITPSACFYTKKQALDFFKLCGDNANQVLMVLGNHEHYDFRFEDTKDAIQDLIQDSGASNIKLLDNEFFDIEEFSVFGATLWTDLNNSCPVTSMHASYYMTDYSVISKNGVSLKPQDTISENANSRILIQEFLDFNEGERRSIILTHHTPTILGIPEELRNASSFSYANTGLEEMILNSSSLELWASGHVHVPYDYTVGKCRCVGNPRGYPKQNVTWELVSYTL